MRQEAHSKPDVRENWSPNVDAKAGQEVIEVDVAIVGNGPAGLALSAALAGSIPRVSIKKLQTHLDPSIRVVGARLKEMFPDNDPLLTELDLYSMSKGVKNRCINPIAALVDKLRYPDPSRVGGSLLTYDSNWKTNKISHVLVGNKKGGGSWQDMSPEFQTISPAHWMLLPGARIPRGHILERSNRAPRHIVAKYYEQYAELYGESDSYVKGKIISAERSPSEKWRLVIKVNEQINNKFSADSLNSLGSNKEKVRLIYAKRLVVAVGMADLPRKLHIPGEGLDFVSHRPSPYSKIVHGNKAHLLVVGARLSAADMLIHWLAHSSMTVRITHVFRNSPTKEYLWERFGNRPEPYLDERHLARLMAQLDTDQRYNPIQGSLVSIEDDGTCTILSGTTGEHHKVAATHVVICIGSTPDLSWLPKDIQEQLPKDAYNAKRPLRLDGSLYSQPVFVPVDESTFEVVDSNGRPLCKDSLFAIGAVRGDNFVRYTIGDAFGLQRHISKI